MSHFKFLIFVTFFFYSFVTFWVFDLCHLLSFWVLSNYKFLNFVTFTGFCVLSHIVFWVFKFRFFFSFVTLNTGIAQIGWSHHLPLFWQSCVNGDILLFYSDVFLVCQFVYPCQNKLKKSKQPNMIWGPLKKGFPFGINASNRIGQGSHCHLYAEFFTGLLVAGFEDKQGEYVKPLLIEHEIFFCLVMNVLYCLLILTFWKFPKWKRKQVICGFVYAFNAPLRRRL